jgi:hypothetical protein
MRTRSRYYFSIAAAWLLGLVAQQFRQPSCKLICRGPRAGRIGLIAAPDSIGVIAELGLIFLLFMISPEIDLKVSSARSLDHPDGAGPNLHRRSLGVFFRICGFGLGSRNGTHSISVWRALNARSSS